MEVLARAALIVLYWGGKQSAASFLFGASSLGGVLNGVGGLAAGPLSHFVTYFLLPTLVTWD